MLDGQTRRIGWGVRNSGRPGDLVVRHDVTASPNSRSNLLSIYLLYALIFLIMLSEAVFHDCWSSLWWHSSQCYCVSSQLVQKGHRRAVSIEVFEYEALTGNQLWMSCIIVLCLRPLRSSSARSCALH
jgi:hypothetical protein